jgi:hypothetical protein
VVKISYAKKRRQRNDWAIISFSSGWLIAGVWMYSPQGQESHIAADSSHGEKFRALEQCIAQELEVTAF